LARRPPRASPFPYTTLFRSAPRLPPTVVRSAAHCLASGVLSWPEDLTDLVERGRHGLLELERRGVSVPVRDASAPTVTHQRLGVDRKSTRLNSSHGKTSDAV